jgi:hypothetical protein
MDLCRKTPAIGMHIAGCRPGAGQVLPVHAFLYRSWSISALLGFPEGLRSDQQTWRHRGFVADTDSGDPNTGSFTSWARCRQ